jgi:hypothetical protein
MKSQGNLHNNPILNIKLHTVEPGKYFNIYYSNLRVLVFRKCARYYSLINQSKPNLERVSILFHLRVQVLIAVTNDNGTN